MRARVEPQIALARDPLEDENLRNKADAVWELLLARNDRLKRSFGKRAMAISRRRGREVREPLRQSRAGSCSGAYSAEFITVDVVKLLLVGDCARVAAVRTWVCRA
jgi:hypothetical protein